MNERNNLYEKTYSCDYDKIVTDMHKSNIATLRKYKFQRWEKCGSTPHRVAKKKGRIPPRVCVPFSYTPAVSAMIPIFMFRFCLLLQHSYSLDFPLVLPISPDTFHQWMNKYLRPEPVPEPPSSIFL